MGQADSTTCHDNFAAIQQTYQNLGIPLSPEKLEGPVHPLTFLGIEMDTIRTEARLPQDKLTCISKLLSTWRGRYFLWLDPFSTPVRLYNHAGHTFTAQMYNTAAKVKELQHLTYFIMSACVLYRIVFVSGIS